MKVPTNNTPDIPREALDIRYNSSGSLPDVGLHERDGIYYQESSYSHFGFFGVMLAVAVMIVFAPWETQAMFFKLKYWMAIGCIWGGICGLIAYFIRNACGQHIIIDPKAKTISITCKDLKETISWDQIVGLQICYETNPTDSDFNGFQLNLVWLAAEGNVKRHCLLKHATKSHVIDFGKEYESLFKFPLLDHSQNK